MQTFSTLTDAIALAEFAHRNQQDKAGLPYIDHPKRVLANVQAMGARPYVQMAAVLHDVTEDTKFTSAMLLDLGFSPAVTQLIDLLDRHTSHDRFFRENAGRDLASERYNGKYWFASLGPEAEDEFYYANIYNFEDAKMIKLADIADNTAQWRLSYLPLETQERLIKKYHHALDLLGQNW